MTSWHLTNLALMMLLQYYTQFLTSYTCLFNSIHFCQSTMTVLRWNCKNTIHISYGCHTGKNILTGPYTKSSKTIISDVCTKYQEASKIVNLALQGLISQCVPGAKIVDLCKVNNQVYNLKWLCVCVFFVGSFFFGRGNACEMRVCRDRYWRWVGPC